MLKTIQEVRNDGMKATRLTNRFYAELRDDEICKFLPENYLESWVELLVTEKMNSNPTKRERD